MFEESDTRITSVAGRFHSRPWLIRPRDVYIAGPFFTSDQVTAIEFIHGALAAEGLTFFSPMVECRYNARTDPPEKAEEAFILNRWHIQGCRFVVAELSWPDMGTSWELGYADAKGIPRLGLYRDPMGKINLMLRQTVTALVATDQLPAALKSILIDVRDRGIRTWVGAIKHLGSNYETWKGEQE